MNSTIGREAVIEVGGKKYCLARFDRGILARFMTWAEAKLPNPLDVIAAKVKDFPPELQKVMVQEAMNKAAVHRVFHSPEVQALLATVEGSAYLFYLLFQKHHPDISEKEAEAVYQAACEEHGYGYVEKKLAEAEGRMPVPESDLERHYLQEAGLIQDPEKRG